MTPEECANVIQSSGDIRADEQGETALAAAAAHLRRLAALERENQRLRAVLRTLVRLKDGPRDEAYYAEKDFAWQQAREALEGGDA